MKRGVIATVAVVVLAAGIGIQQASGGSGSVSVTDVRLPQPAGGASTASVYATIRNPTGAAVRLVGVKADVGGATSLMQEITRGGAGYMTDVPSITVPAHQSVRMSPGVRHAMIQSVAGLGLGTRVTLRFEFDEADEVVVQTTVGTLR